MSRISGIFAGKIPEFRDWEKDGISGNPEIGISGIAITKCVPSIIFVVAAVR
jgi:hypothetical protein